MHTRSNPTDQKIARTKTGKAVLQQQALRGCTGTCTEMLKADHGKRINVNNMQTDGGSTKTIKFDLEESGFDVIIHKEVPLKKCQHYLTKYGSAIIDTDPGYGGHMMILDKVDLANQTARVRDPYHGWEITITLDALHRVTKGSLYGYDPNFIQVVRRSK